MFCCRGCCAFGDVLVNFGVENDVVVSMELTGGSMELQLQYQMFINDSDEWKLKNLSLAGINLGRQYFAQFSALMTEYDNNIDSVLDNWK